MSDEAMDFLLSSGAPTVKFPVVGTVVRGTIIDMKKTQQTDIDGNLLTWDSGEPRWQLVFTLETSERDRSIDGDDGVRRLYAKYKLLDAIRKAVRDSGFRGKSLAGGELVVKFTGEDPPARRGLSPTKLYAAKFTPPDPAAAGDLFDDEPQAEPGNASTSPVADDDILF